MLRAVLHIISDRQRHALALEDALLESAQGGADFLQIRQKKAPAAETHDLVRSLQARLAERAAKARILINDRVDIALATDAAGVHLAAKSLPIEAAVTLRARCTWQGLIGCSVHALDEALAAQAQGVDYVTYGHVFSTQSHSGIAPRGVTELAEIVERLRIPVIAIGGITAENVDAVLQTGCSGIAVIGAILERRDPRAATAALIERMERCAVRPRAAFSRRIDTRGSKDGKDV